MNNTSARAPDLTAHEQNKRLQLGDMTVYLVERHNWALVPWAQVKSEHEAQPLVLLSLDYHQDSLPPFNRHCGCHCVLDEVTGPAVERELAAIDRRYPVSVAAAAGKLNHDEQTATAVRLGIFEAAFVVSFQQGSCETPKSHQQERYMAQFELDAMIARGGRAPREMPPRPHTYPRSKDGLYLVGSSCTPGCRKRPHDDDCNQREHDAAIDSDYLESRLGTANEMATSALGWSSWRQNPYVLDVDLDYFNTRKSVAPPDPTLFHALIKGAVAMTIAMERNCVQNCALSGEELDADWLLERVLEHVKVARGPSMKGESKSRSAARR